MKNLLACFVFAALVAVALGGPYDSCAIMDADYHLYDITSTTYNTTDDYGVISANLCVDMERSCSHSTNQACSICQYIDVSLSTEHSYCIGYNRDEVYSVLDSSVYGSANGFRITMTGDTDYCPNGLARKTNIDVLCGQTTDALIFHDETVSCVYNFQMYLRSACTISAASFTPSFSISSRTPNAIEVAIDDKYNFMYWTYSILFNDKLAYTGYDRRVVVQNLDAGKTYSVVVTTDSGAGAVTSMTSSSPATVVTTLPAAIGEVHTVVVDGQGKGVAIGIIIAVAVFGAIFGIWKFTKTEFFQEKFGGGGGGGKSSKGFSLMDAEKSNAFE